MTAESLRQERTQRKVVIDTARAVVRGAASLGDLAVVVALHDELSGRPARDSEPPATMSQETATTAPDLLEAAWGIIANVSEGDWHKQQDDWHTAAVRWRDGYHAWLDQHLARR